jgi:hypothetical protein
MTVDYTFLSFTALFLFVVIFKWHFCTVSSYSRFFFLFIFHNSRCSARRVNIYICVELRIWLNERVKEKKIACIVHDSTLWNTRKSLTLVVTDGCWPPLLLLTNTRAHIMYKLIERARKKSVCSRDCIASGWPWSKRREERGKEKK